MKRKWIERKKKLEHTQRKQCDTDYKNDWIIKNVLVEEEKKKFKIWKSEREREKVL